MHTLGACRRDLSKRSSVINCAGPGGVMILEGCNFSLFSLEVTVLFKKIVVL